MTLREKSIYFEVKQVAFGVGAMTVSTRDRIIEVAIDLIAKNGYSETSIRDIAKNVGIKTSSIYYHFESKETILNYILNMYIKIVTENEHLRKWHKEKDYVISRNRNISVQEIINYLFFKFDEQHSAQYRKIVKIICSEATRNDVVRNYLQEHNIKTNFKHIKSVLDTLLEAKKIPKCDTAKLAGALYSITIAFMHLDSIDLQHISEDYEGTDMFSLLEYTLKTMLDGLP